MAIQPGPGYTFSASSLGENITITPPWSEWDPNVSVLPLWPKLKENKVTIEPGTVNRFIPTIGGIYIDAPTPPFITVSGEGYICIRISYVANTFFPRTAEIVFYAGSVSPVDTATYGYYPLAKINAVTVSGVTTYSMIIFSYGNFVCNRLKAGAGTAVYYWATITPQPGA
jgi:hypothetical protein